MNFNYSSWSYSFSKDGVKYLDTNVCLIFNCAYFMRINSKYSICNLSLNYFMDNAHYSQGDYWKLDPSYQRYFLCA